MALTREDRERNGRRGAYVRLAQEADWAAVTAPARAALASKWEREVDPAVTDPAQRARMAEAARKAFYLDLAEKSRKARAARKAKVTTS